MDIQHIVCLDHCLCLNLLAKIYKGAEYNICTFIANQMAFKCHFYLMFLCVTVQIKNVKNGTLCCLYFYSGKVGHCCKHTIALGVYFHVSKCLFGG